MNHVIADCSDKGENALKILHTPISENDINDLKVGDMIYISGNILCGRDAVLPKVVDLLDGEDSFEKRLIKDKLVGSVIFHTAVSRAGVGPTSSNKLEIESSIAPLSKAGVKLHLGKGALHDITITELDVYNSVYAVIPPVTALLENKTLSKEVIAFEHLGMESLFELKVDKYPAIIAAAHGKSIY